MLKPCSHSQTAYCSLSRLEDGRFYLAEVCACGVVRWFGVSSKHGGRYRGASMSLLQEGHREFEPFQRRLPETFSTGISAEV